LHCIKRRGYEALHEIRYCDFEALVAKDEWRTWPWLILKYQLEIFLEGLMNTVKKSQDRQSTEQLLNANWIRNDMHTHFIESNVRAKWWRGEITVTNWMDHVHFYVPD
jgi:hypothetical protein